MIPIFQASNNFKNDKIFISVLCTKGFFVLKNISRKQFNNISSDILIFYIFDSVILKK